MSGANRYANAYSGNFFFCLLIFIQHHYWMFFVPSCTYSFQRDNCIHGHDYCDLCMYECAYSDCMCFLETVYPAISPLYVYIHFILRRVYWSCVNVGNIEHTFSNWFTLDHICRQFFPLVHWDDWSKVM